MKGGKLHWNNYRVTINLPNINYFENFAQCSDYIPMIKKIFDKANYIGITDIWYFFEPHIEITWLCDSQEISDCLLYHIDNIANDNFLHIKSYLNPETGQFADWFGLSKAEMEFSRKMYVITSKMALEFYSNKETINSGLGLPMQLTRGIHSLSNQLGLTYRDEEKFTRGYLKRVRKLWYNQYIPYKLNKFLGNQLFNKIDKPLKVVLQKIYGQTKDLLKFY